MNTPGLSLSPRHLQGLLTALCKRSFASTEAELAEAEAYDNASLMEQLGCTDESEIVIVDGALRAACSHMWADSALKIYLQGGLPGAGAEGSAGASTGTGSGASGDAATAAGDDASGEKQAQAQAPAHTQAPLQRLELTLSDEQVSSFLRHWVDNKEKLRAKLVAQTCWNRQYAALDWRIDVQALSSDNADNAPAAGAEADTSLGAPLAFFELNTRAGHVAGLKGAEASSSLEPDLSVSVGAGASWNEKDGGSVLRFEMTQAEVQGFTDTLDEVARAIEQASY